tara:strand:+ start:2064 stop:3230 length:1167 start_codon:yes stop_codon:yes gene_type:complete
MTNNKLIIAAAGSGKTTLIVKEALNIDKSEKVLITTYTIENEKEIRSKILRERKSIPANITIQTWFSFLMQHGVKPYQGSMNDMLFENDIKGMLLSNEKSAPKFDERGRPLFIRGGGRQYYGEKDFKEFYFTSNWRIFSDKISKFVIGCNEKTKGKIFTRLSKIYSTIYIDEVQDLAGFDFEIIKMLFKSNINITLVGDPRQVTYATNHYRKYPKYKNGKIKEFVNSELGKRIGCTTDESSLKKSHRNNQKICDYSSRLYPDFEKIEPCECVNCRKTTTHDGIFVVRENDVAEYLETFNSTQLRYSKATKVDIAYDVCNFGEVKGKTINRVIIYPTSDIKKWIKSNDAELKDGTKARFYVALTRAKYSVAIVYNYSDNEEINGVEKWK